MSEPKTTTGEVQPQAVGEDPLFHFTKVFVRFLQVVFHSFEKGSYRWEPDLEQTDITISDQFTVNNPAAEKRPSIVCMRGQADWLNVSMDQFKSFDFATGARSHTDLVASAMLYSCLSREGLEAQRLAWIAGYATRTLKRHLMRLGMHRVGENVGYSAEMPAERIIPDAKGYRAVQVMVPFFFQDTYSIAPIDNLLLKGLDLRLTSEAVSQSESQASSLRPPSYGGRVLKTTKVFSLTQRVLPLGAITQKPRK